MSALLSNNIEHPSGEPRRRQKGGCPHRSDHPLAVGSAGMPGVEAAVYVVSASQPAISPCIRRRAGKKTEVVARLRDAIIPQQVCILVGGAAPGPFVGLREPTGPGQPLNLPLKSNSSAFTPNICIVDAAFVLTSPN